MTDTTRADMDELINLLREIRPNYGDVGSRDVDVRKRQEQIDRAIGLLARQPAAIDSQEAVATLHDDGHWTWKGTPPYESNYAGWRMEVYAAPAAPSVEQDERGAFAQAAIRMLEGYAESYDCMSRMDGGGNKVQCSSVAFDIRHNMAGWIKARAASTSANVAQGSKLSVSFGPMPESNGKTNWTAILHRGDLAEGHTIDRSEYPDRVRYAADCVRYLIGELPERPWILDYDADKHSGYVANVAQGAEAKLEFMPVDSMQHAIVYGSPEAIGALKARMERDYRVASLVAAPPAQTALTDDARVKIHAAWDDLNAVLRGCGNKYLERAAETLSVLLTAAQSASGDTQ